MDSFYVRNIEDGELLGNIAEDLLKLVDIIAGCTDLDEVYYATEEEDRYLLEKYIKSKFLPK